MQRVRILRGSMLIMLLLHLILHPAQPAALTAVAMETSGAREEALGDEMQAERRNEERNRKLRKDEWSRKGTRTGRGGGTS